MGAATARGGLFALTLVVALVLAALGRRGQPDDVVIGVSFAWILGIGVLLITVLATSTGAGNGIVTVSTLFGSIYSLTGAGAASAAAIGFAVVVLLLLGFRPLLLPTLDADLAVLRGLPVGLIGAGFLALLALVTAESAQAVRTLLLTGLLAAPAATAHRLTARPIAVSPSPPASPCCARGWARPQLRDSLAAPEQRDHRTRRGHLRPDAVGDAPA